MVKQGIISTSYEEYIAALTMISLITTTEAFKEKHTTEATAKPATWKPMKILR